MPTAKYDRYVWAQLLDCARNADCCPNMRSGQYRDTQAESVRCLAKNRFFVIGMNQVVHELDCEASLQQWRCKTEQRKRRAQGRAVIRRIEQHDFVGSRQIASNFER